MLCRIWENRLFHWNEGNLKYQIYSIWYVEYLDTWYIYHRNWNVLNKLCVVHWITFEIKKRTVLVVKILMWAVKFNLRMFRGKKTEILIIEMFSFYIHFDKTIIYDLSR